jgi:hypothetical protein
MPSALAVAILALALAVAGCRPAPDSQRLRDEALLLASDREFLAERRALVEAGRYREAHAQWATRALLPEADDVIDTGEQGLSRRISAAIDDVERQGARARTLYRLAQNFDRAGWIRETRAALERSRRLGPLDTGARELLTTATTITRFTIAADSALNASYAAVERGGTDPAIATVISGLMSRFGISNETLRSRRLYLGQRPAAAAPDVDEVELSVIVGHEGPLAIRQGEDEVGARRIVLDDNLLAPYRPAAEKATWESGSIALVDEGVLLVYHRRSRLRRVATRLALELERRGGREPDADRTADEEVPLALRLKGASPVFDRLRTAMTSRREIQREFILEVSEAMMAQDEAAAARHLIEERLSPGTGGGTRAAERRLLAALRYAPLPHLRLAGVVEAAARTDDDSPEARAARQLLRHLERLMGEEADRGGRPWRAAELITLSESRLQELVAIIEADRFRTR